MPLEHPLVPALGCRDTKGIVRGVAGLLLPAGRDIADAQPLGGLGGAQT